MLVKAFLFKPTLFKEQCCLELHDILVHSRNVYQSVAGQVFHRKKKNQGNKLCYDWCSVYNTYALIGPCRKSGKHWERNVSLKNPHMDKEHSFWGVDNSLIFIDVLLKCVRCLQHIPLFPVLEFCYPKSHCTLVTTGDCIQQEKEPISFEDLITNTRLVVFPSKCEANFT